MERTTTTDTDKNVPVAVIRLPAIDAPLVRELSKWWLPVTEYRDGTFTIQLYDYGLEGNTDRARYGRYRPRRVGGGEIPAEPEEQHAHQPRRGKRGGVRGIEGNDRVPIQTTRRKGGTFRRPNATVAGHAVGVDEGDTGEGGIGVEGTEVSLRGATLPEPATAKRVLTDTGIEPTI